jgi:toxin ParE1/3/4
VTRKLTLRRQARKDLSEIWIYTADKWSADQADTYLRRIGDIFALLCSNPRIARLHEQYTPAVRIQPYLSHVVIFVADDESVEIIRIAHARSDWRRSVDALAGPDPSSS